jgi:hypothetical protein
MKKYWYFISYKHSNTGFGNCELPLSIKITSIEHIRDIQKVLEDKYNITKVLVDNFILLREIDS